MDFSKKERKARVIRAGFSSHTVEGLAMPPADDWPWDRYRAVLVELARKLMIDLNPRLKRRFDSSELVQETLVRAVKYRSKYRGGPREVERLGWLKEILRNYVIERIRKETKRATDPRVERYVDESLDNSFRRFVNFVAEQSSPSQHEQTREEMARLFAALQLLPENQRLVIELHALQELSIKETAERLGLSSAKAAAGLYARGLVQLHKFLGSKE
jgi:RNA polymerase sigma-70 factor (subfamily 1)